MIEVSKSADNNRLVLSYGSSVLVTDRRKLMMLRNITKASSSEGSTFTIPAENLSETIRLLSSALRKLRIDETVILSDDLQTAASVAKNKEDEFKRFSERARSIRNDQHEVSEMRSFINGMKNFRRELKPFQLLAAYHLAYAQNAGNFSVPGAGKTSVVLAAYSFLSGTDDKGKRIGALVVVSPLAAFKAWKDEFRECFGYAPKVLEIYGKSTIPKKSIKSILLSGKQSYDIVLVGYQSISSFEDELSLYLSANEGMFVLDEAHRIKKVGGGQWADCVLRLAPKAKSRVVLTGTPAPNGYVDLKNLFDFMWPKDNIIGYSAAQLRDMTMNEDDARSNDLSHRISPFFIRVNKKHLELPSATFHAPISIEMDSDQKRIYEGIANIYLPKLRNYTDTQTGSFRAKLIRLRQAASNPSMVLSSLEEYYSESGVDDDARGTALEDDLKIGEDLERLAREYSRTGTPPKFKATLQLVEQIITRGEKVIVWCEFVKNITDLGQYLKRHGVEAQYLYGGIEKTDRDEIIERFHDIDSEFKVIIANPHAVGESISLHHACHNAIYFEMSFNAAAYMQSKDRIHRLGLSDDTVTNYYFLATKDTVDETVYERVIKKEQKMIDLLDSREIPLLVNNADFEEESKDDIKAVIRDYYYQRGAK